MGRAVVLALMLAWCLGAGALPSKKALEEAVPIVNELVRDDYGKMKNGTISKAELAEKVLGYVGDAETGTEKYVLLKRAFDLYMACGDCTRALQTYTRFAETLKVREEGVFAGWVDPFVANIAKKKRADLLDAILLFALDSGDMASATAIENAIRPYMAKLRKSKHGLYLLMTVGRVREQRQRDKDLKSLKAAVKNNPGDRTLREKLGMLYARNGTWSAAIEEFLESGCEIAEIAIWEKQYPETGISELTSAKVAEFWWARAEDQKSDETLSKSLRSHSLGWYRKAIDNGDLTGLKRTLAEKRIQEFADRRDVTTAGDKPKPTAVERKPALAKSARQSPKENPVKPLSFNLGKGVAIDFIGCPAGELVMRHGFVPEDKPKPKTRITRNFWIGKFPLTRAQWFALGMDRDFQFEGGFKAYANENYARCAEALGKDLTFNFISSAAKWKVCQVLTVRFRSKLPKGYIVRLPTAAEWEYAFEANSTDPGDPYHKLGSQGECSGADAESVGCPFLVDCRDMAKLKGEKIGKLYEKALAEVNHGSSGSGDFLLYWPCGMHRPNAWGIHDFIGHREFLMDTFDASKVVRSGRMTAGAVELTEMQDMVEPKDHFTWNGFGGFSWVRTAFGDGALRSDKGSLVAKRSFMVGNQFTYGRMGWDALRLVIGPDLVKERTGKDIFMELEKAGLLDGRR